MLLVFWIAGLIAVAALLLGLKFSRLQEEQVWEEARRCHCPPDPFESKSSKVKIRMSLPIPEVRT
jgi:hypothetical protein